MNNEFDEEVILNTQEETVDLNATESDENSEIESIDDMRARLAKAEELANNYKIRAEKAERKTKTESPSETKKSDPNLSTIDIIALTKANIETDDIPDVLEYAKFKGIPVSEALKSTTVRSILSEKAEQRNIALATNTGGAKRSSGKVSDDTLIANAQRGNLPESDADIARLIATRYRK